MDAAMELLLLLLLFTISPFLRSASGTPSKHNYCCDWCPRHSTASLFPPAAAGLDGKGDGGGACGYGAAMATEELNDGGPHVAAAGAEFFREGAGCGACYQLRCRDRRVCADGGVKVVVTGAANRTAGFQLGREAFAAMTRRGMADQLDALLDDNVQVDFRRVPCEYRKNLTVRVEEGSRNPGQLGIQFLYQSGQTDIAAVEIAAQATNNHTQQQALPPPIWRPMARLRRRRVWRTTRAPAGPLQLRLVVTAGLGGKWLRAQDTVLPADWRPGQAYDTGLRVTDVALRTCARPCRARVAAGGGGGEELR
ncbi:unnamed protein product [Urochloa humidicola]